MISNETIENESVSVFVTDSQIHGKGLFAGTDISRGSYIGFYQGEKTLENDVYVLWVNQSEKTPDGEEEIWLGYDGINELRYLNHSAQANCEFDGQHLYALRDIAQNEELTFDYGEWFSVEQD
ncbi:MAG: hypothetical protein ACI9H8_000741 [Lysobacterales bacterium]